jgi:hypothetical protein
VHHRERAAARPLEPASSLLGGPFWRPFRTLRSGFPALKPWAESAAPAARGATDHSEIPILFVQFMTDPFSSPKKNSHDLSAAELRKNRHSNRDLDLPSFDGWPAIFRTDPKHSVIASHIMAWFPRRSNLVNATGDRGTFTKPTEMER